MNDKIRIAVVGLGNMGTPHCRDLAASEGADLCAVVDVDAARAGRVADEVGAAAYGDFVTMLDAMEPDGIVVATPHPSHRELTEEAFERGVHVLVEKPIAVEVAEATAMNEAYEAARRTRPDLRFAVMFQQRTYGHWREIRRMVLEGELGRLMRMTWIITDWFRTQSYYDSGGWRASWRNEGGGVTMNQAPHNLDIYQWIAGRPARLTAVGAFGKYHSIEVEDEITIIAEHPSGMVGHIVSSTAESPGTNRLEVVGELGKLVFENGRLFHERTAQSVLEYIRTSTETMTHVPAEAGEVAYHHHGEAGHRLILENFVEAIRDRSVALIADGRDGVASLEIANAAIMSARERRSLDLPLSPRDYHTFLRSLRAGAVT